MPPAGYFLNNKYLIRRVEWVVGEGCKARLSWKDIRGVRHMGITPPNPSTDVKLAYLDLRSSGTEWFSKMTVHGEGRVGHGRGLQCFLYIYHRCMLNIEYQTV